MADFGLEGSGETPRDAPGFVLGTPAYMAPEQAAASGGQPAVDIYGLGVTLHQLATGTMPGPDAPQALPEPVRSVVARCLDPDPAPSPHRRGGVRDAGRAHHPGRASHAGPPPASRPRRAAPARPRRTGRLAAGLLLVLLVAAIVILAATSGGAGDRTVPLTTTRASGRPRRSRRPPRPRPRLACSHVGCASTPAEPGSEPGLSSVRMTRNDRSQPPDPQAEPDQPLDKGEDQLDQALEETFPASDPVSAEVPGR